MLKSLTVRKRNLVVKMLMEYNMNVKTTAIITKLSEGDLTAVRLGEGEGLLTSVTSGIRQGCTG